MYPNDLVKLAAMFGVAGLRSSPDVRKIITRSGSGVRTMLFCKRYSEPRLSHESAGETRHSRCCMLSPSVLDLRTQPIVVYVPGGPDLQDFSYTPDARALVCPPGRSEPFDVLVECKDDLAYLNDPLLAPRLKRVTEVFAKFGVPFVVVTSADLPMSMDHNLDTLRRHRRHLGTPQDLLFLRNALSTRTFETLGELVAAVGRVRALHALASHQIFFDHFEKLTDSSRLFSTLTEECDAARHLYAGI
jgi:hypothetical protein